jgi:4-amino-4-deoxy-L-arabinose transferase-like glycosyltransferase
LFWFSQFATVAAFSRFWALDHIPPGIYPDEAINGNEGLEALRTQNFKVFYPTNEGREGLWINMVGVSVWLFGANGFGLRFWSALFGTLTVPFLYLLVRELFSTRAAFFSSFLLAMSFWHLNFSRIAFSAISVPFLMTSSLYLLFAGWRRSSSECFVARGTMLSAVFGGALYGAGFHTYVAYRFTPLVVLLILCVEYFRWNKARADLQRWLAATLLWLLVAFLVAFPNKSMALIAVLTGLRRGELFALRWVPWISTVR